MRRRNTVAPGGETSPLAFVHSCSGWPSVAQLALDVARRLERLGVAEASAGSDLDAVAAVARSGRTVLTIDGCPSGCATRALEAKGIRPARSVSLHEVGVRKGAQLGEAEREKIVAGVLSRLWGASGTGTAGAVPRRRRPPPPAQGPRTGHAHSTEDYLLAVRALAITAVDCGAVVSDAPTLAAHVSLALGVSRAAAGEMLGRLEAAGLVERGSKREVLLTESGRAAGARAVRRHRLLELFAVDFLGYEPADAYEQARRLRNALDDEVIERIAGRLAGTGRCPHGWPVDPALERDESPGLVALSALALGDRGVVSRLVEHDADLVRWLYRHGLEPGVEVEIRGDDRSAESLLVRVGAAERTIARRAAGEVFIRVDGARAASPRAAAVAQATTR